VSDFGDITPDDVVDSAPPDPEALARLFARERRRIADDDYYPDFDEMHDYEKALHVFVFAAIIDKIAREWRPS